MQYVIEHLESIKYQIEHYGNNYKVNFLLCDDSSSDQTVTIVNTWLKENNIFFKTKIIASAANQGIVKNYITALKNIGTECFKILGGDDLYYKNNIFYASEYSDFSITPVFKLKGTEVFHESNWMFDRYVANIKNLNTMIRKDYEYFYMFETPGVFWNHKYAGEGLYDELSQYNWCEDLPCWNYLFHLNQMETTMLNKPYIIYRIGSGISTNKKHKKNKALEAEAEYIHKKVFKKCHKYPKMINPYRYSYKVIKTYYQILMSQVNKDIINFENELKKEIQTAKTFYIEIYDKSAKWARENGFKKIYKK